MSNWCLPIDWHFCRLRLAMTIVWNEDFYQSCVVVVVVILSSSHPVHMGHQWVTDCMSECLAGDGLASWQNSFQTNRKIIQPTSVIPNSQVSASVRLTCVGKWKKQTKWKTGELLIIVVVNLDVGNKKNENQMFRLMFAKLAAAIIIFRHSCLYVTIICFDFVVLFTAPVGQAANLP